MHSCRNFSLKAGSVKTNSIYWIFLTLRLRRWKLYAHFPNQMVTKQEVLINLFFIRVTVYKCKNFPGNLGWKNQHSSYGWASIWITKKHFEGGFKLTRYQRRELYCSIFKKLCHCKRKTIERKVEGSNQARNQRETWVWISDGSKLAVFKGLFWLRQSRRRELLAWCFNQIIRREKSIQFQLYSENQGCSYSGN